MKPVRFLAGLFLSTALLAGAFAAEAKTPAPADKNPEGCDCGKDKDGKVCGVDKDCCCTGQKATKPADKKEEKKPDDKDAKKDGKKTG